MTTASSNDIQDTIRNYLLTFTPQAGPRIVDLIGTLGNSSGSDGCFYIDVAPSDVPDDSVWMVMGQVDGDRGGADGGKLRTAVLELTIASFDRRHAATISNVLDVLEEAWNNWVHFSDGTIIAREAHGRMNPRVIGADDPGDRNAVMGRILLNYTAAPAYLTGRHNT